MRNYFTYIFSLSSTKVRPFFKSKIWLKISFLEDLLITYRLGLSLFFLGIMSTSSLPKCASSGFHSVHWSTSSTKRLDVVTSWLLVPWLHVLDLSRIRKLLLNSWIFTGISLLLAVLAFSVPLFLLTGSTKMIWVGLSSWVRQLQGLLVNLIW